jgi:hypothetical protein
MGCVLELAPDSRNDCLFPLFRPMSSNHKMFDVFFSLRNRILNPMADEDAEGDDKTSCLKNGDIVSLFALEAFGFLKADGFVSDDLTVEPLDVKDPVPQNFEASLFQIESKLSYFAQEKLRRFVHDNHMQSALEFDLLKGEKANTATLLRAEAEKEIKRNSEESKYNASRPVVYGQAFQLRHINTNKFLSVVFGANVSDVHGSADVELSTGSMASYFYLQSDRNIKSHSEQCYERELVLLVPDMLRSIALTTHRGKVEFDKHNKMKRTPRSVSCTKEGSVWLVSRYQNAAHAMASTPEVEKTSASGGDARGLAAAQNAEMDEIAPQPLHTGQVVRLRHQEADVFLAADNNVKNANDKKSSSSLLVTEPACGFGTTGYAANASEAPGTCYTLWIVENLDPTVVRPLTMGKPFRLRNLATGTYLLTHYFAVTPLGGTRNSSFGGTARTARNTWNASLASGSVGDQGGEAGTHIAFCGREAHLLTSMRSIMTLHSSSFANEGVSFSEDDNLVRSQSILYLKFEHLPPRAWGGLTTGGSALPKAGSEGSGSHASTPRNFRSQDPGTARIPSKLAPEDARAAGWGVLGNRGVIGSELQGTMEGKANSRHQHILKITVYRDFV